MNKFSKNIYYSIVSIILLLLVGCSTSTSSSKNTKPYYSLDKGIELLAGNINAFLEESVQTGTMPEVLDIAILAIEEKTTRQRLQFGSFVASKISNLMSVKIGEKNNSIMLIEPEKIRSEINKQSQNNTGKQNLNLFKLSSILKSNLMIKGTFFQENAQHLIIQIEIIDPKNEFVYKAFDIGIQVDSISTQLTQSFPYFIKRSFEELYKKLDGSNIKNIPALINQNWNEYFTNMQRNSLRELVTQKIFADIEGLVTDDDQARSRLNTIDKIQAEKKHISIYFQKRIQIETLDFDYTLSNDQNQKVESALVYIGKIETMIANGIQVALSFIAESDDNEPLDFECDGDVEIVINFDTILLNYEYASCAEEGKRQVMTWLSPFELIAKTWIVNIAEENVFGDEVVKALIPVTANTLLRIYYQGFDEIRLPGSEFYTIKLIRADK